MAGTVIATATVASLKPACLHSRWQRSTNAQRSALRTPCMRVGVRASSNSSSPGQTDDGSFTRSEAGYSVLGAGQGLWLKMGDQPQGEGGKGQRSRVQQSQAVEDGNASPPPALFPWQPQIHSLVPFTPLNKQECKPVLAVASGALAVGAPLLPSAGEAPAVQSMSQGAARGMILRAAMGTGWTTETGLEGPSLAPEFPSPTIASLGLGRSSGGLMPLQGEGEESARKSWPELTSSPRRTARVKFTCNRCGERTMRAINPHAYEEGTVFVQCAGCLVFHKLVDNLNLFHELNGQIFQGSDAGNRGFGIHDSVDILGAEDDFPQFPGL